jgi:LAO/AO transport system kinase
MPADAKHLAARRELAQAISAVERPGPAANQRIQEALAASAAEARHALVVGVTGAPGAGKSSLAAALADVARASGRRVAILAFDPSSHESGGALLGDRVRMDEHPEDDGRYTRSIATRGSGRSLAHVAAAATILVEAAGFDLIFVETVGAGQAEIGIARLADVLLVVEGPEGGDEVQAMKAGILEAADIVAVNKSDRPGAQAAYDRLRSGLALGAGAPQLALVSATANAGIRELLVTIDDVGSGLGPRGRIRRVEAHLVAAAESHVDAQVRAATASGALAARAEGIVSGAVPLTGSLTALFGISESVDA